MPVMVCPYPDGGNAKEREVGRTMAEKTRYSDAELEEFRAIILEKLEIAKRDYELFAIRGYEFRR